MFLWVCVSEAHKYQTSVKLIRDIFFNIAEEGINTTH